jgi:hypothetical protein
VGSDPVEALVSPNGGYLIVSNNGSQDLSVFGINPDGSLAPVGTFPTDDPTQGPAGLVMDSDNHLFQVNGGFLSPAAAATAQSVTRKSEVDAAPGIEGVGTATVSVYDVAPTGTPTPVPGSPFDTGVNSVPTGVVLVARDLCRPVTTLEVSSEVILLGGRTGDVTVTTVEALEVGSTDIVMHFDPTQLQAQSASSSTLGFFNFTIDNAAGEVRTASAAFPSELLSAGDPLFTVTFASAPGATLEGTTAVTLSDADRDACDDLAGPVPPVPPASLPYDQVAGIQRIGGLGDVDCDNLLTPVDASVILGLFVGTITDDMLPPPCNAPAFRRQVSDWDLDVILSPVDASVTLGAFVEIIEPGCTPLGASLGLSCSSMSAGMSEGTRTIALDAGAIALDAGGPVTLTLSRVSARRGEEVAIEAIPEQALEVGSADLALSFDGGGLEVVAVESPLEGFTYQVDTEAGLIRTASAGIGQTVEAGEPLIRVVFGVGEDARGRYAVRVVDGDDAAPLDIAGPVQPGQMPEPIALEAKTGVIKVESTRGGTGSCGLGFELALLVPPLVWFRRRRRGRNEDPE